MPSTSSFTSTEKALVKKHAPGGQGDKIHAAAVGRIYYAYPDPAKWSYSGISGAVVFGWGTTGGWLKVVDLAGTRGVIWQHGVVEDMQYYQDRTFFHTFPSDDCMIGIAFSSESEAADLFKKMSLRHKYAAKASGGSGRAGSSAAAASSAAGTKSPSKAKKRKGGIDKSMIGAPTGFSHVAHMGFDAQEGFSTRNIDPSWERLFQQLEGQGISRSQIEKNEHFIRNFVEGSGGPAAATTSGMPPGRAPPPPASSSPAFAPVKSAGKRIPPPAPPSRTVKRKPPPPPSRTAGGAAAAASGPPAPPPPPPPVGTARGGAAAAPPPPPPPPPSRGAGPAPSHGPPPPPPPPPPRAGAGPGGPPPPPPPPSSAPRAPPPPPPVGGGDGRGALLASIQGAGLGQLRKVDKSAAENAGSLAALGIVGAGVAGAATTAADVTAATPSGDDSTGGGGGDLASALAAALSQRKGNMGDSEEEEGASEDEEDW